MTFFRTLRTNLFLGLWILSCTHHELTPTQPVTESIYENTGCQKTSLSLASRKTGAIVVKVVDGDTLKLSDGTRVRLVGVDTPETVHRRKPVEYFGREASAFTHHEIEGKTVEIVLDRNGTEHKDRYGRLLAYVFRSDGFDLNAELVRRGYAHAYTRFPFERLEEFRCYEKEARDNKKGLWADPKP